MKRILHFTLPELWSGNLTEAIVLVDGTISFNVMIVDIWEKQKNG